MARQPIDPSPQSLVDAIVQTSFGAMAILTAIGAENDLSLTQLRVLGILRDRRLRMTELADYLGLEKSTMSGLVDRAEKRGLLARAPSADDRRAVDVFLTDAGAMLGERLYADVARSVSRSTDALSDAEQATLMDLLSQMLVPPVRS